MCQRIWAAPIFSYNSAAQLTSAMVRELGSPRPPQVRRSGAPRAPHLGHLQTMVQTMVRGTSRTVLRTSHSRTLRSDSSLFLVHYDHGERQLSVDHQVHLCPRSLPLTTYPRRPATAAHSTFHVRLSKSLVFFY